MELQVAVAKVCKWSVRESGDTVEMIERPHGGLSFVVVDGQHTGRGAKQISNLVARKVISLLAEGVRDGAAARAAHDYLYTQYDGKVSAELHIVSIDLASETVVISHNSHCAPIVSKGKELGLINDPSEAIGVHRRKKPVITEIPLAPHMTIIVYTDGVLDAGIKHGAKFDIVKLVAEELRDENVGAQQLADAIVARANELDRGRPGDDTSVLVVRIVPSTEEDTARRMTVRFPID